MKQPDFIFETSWEVCNKVGGIYAVLSTRAASMQAEHPDKVIFFGPDFGQYSDTWFVEDSSILRGWRPSRKVRIGRWNIPGHPIVVLLNSAGLEARKNEIYAWAWEHFGVQSHAAYDDYDDCCLFSYAAGEIMESLYIYLTATLPQEPCVVAQVNEWQTSFALFYLRQHCPTIGTLFTTHATSIGRSIAFNDKPLYDYFEGYHGDQMAQELNIVSKHSAEKAAAHWADCFTTVSDITAKECKQMLEKDVDVVTPNGFEQGFVPAKEDFEQKRAAARKALKTITQISGIYVEDHPLIVGIAGRLEWKNKGIDIFHEALNRLGQQHLERQVIAFMFIPYLNRPIRHIGQVSIIYLPYYFTHTTTTTDIERALQGFSYFDLLIGLDLTVFPSYYEPWGYTPLESIAFHIPTITSSLAGFGVWAANNGAGKVEKGVEVITRYDSNYSEAADEIAKTIRRFMNLSDKALERARKAAAALSLKADWKHFFPAYRKAYSIALEKAGKRAKAIQK